MQNSFDGETEMKIEETNHIEFRIVIPFEKEIEKPLESTSILQSESGLEKNKKIIRSNPHITSREIAQELGIKLSGLMKHLRKLQETGRIRRVGPNK